MTSMEETPAISPAPIATGIKTNELPGASFRPALIVVDMQNDFCPPVRYLPSLSDKQSAMYTDPISPQSGSLAVSEARDIIPLINSLISSKGFVLKIATQDWHPPNHISFASNHPPPNNKPFVSEIDLENPMFGKISIDIPNNEKKTFKTKKQRLWPVHCVQGTPGAEFVEGLDAQQCDYVVKKGMNSGVEMYSVFADAFGNMDCVKTGGVTHDVIALLQEAEVTDVFVVGVAGDYCVKCTALDSASAGFRTWVIEEATRLVDPSMWEEVKMELSHGGVSMINLSSEKLNEIRKMRA
ncbi:pyrazinamidase/nicotinamidase [Ascosphaera apis ARSEF 7405]|uniref:nicotinamidase n=1 Tax=Ascosphaera apis ARSEF 7405 TaxID=392613 RepID=A0A167WNZ4_9EURO|nr:pyrazinamidase/nicotinamidase [Ascosphaera apis ARSEF 7405]